MVDVAITNAYILKRHETNYDEWKLPILKFRDVFLKIYNTKVIVIQNRTFQGLQSNLFKNNFVHQIHCCYETYSH